VARSELNRSIIYQAKVMTVGVLFSFVILDLSERDG